MATGTVHHAALGLPPAPTGIVHFGVLAVPQGAVGRVHGAELTSLAGSTASGRMHDAAFTVSAAPGQVSPSGVRQLASSGAWSDVPLYQRTSAGEWV